jgi:CelD/BcsL family acetyltransferase involved in cellulose biosynthesis
LEDVREDWIRLADQAGHPFATWEWNECWWRWFADGRELCTYRCRDADGEVIVILPLYVAAVRPLRVARFLGYADMHSPICAPANRPLAAEALREATRQPGGCPLLVAERLPCAEGWGDLLGGKAFERVNDPTLSFGDMSWEEFLASRSSNFRSQVGKRERRAIRKHGLTYRLADDPGRLAEDMGSLFRLHAARWGGETTGVFEGDRAKFHLDFAAESLRRGWLRLWMAEIDGVPAAAWYGWHFADAEWHYQAGRDPSFERESLGFVLTAHAMREAFRSGARAYHFLAGAEEYKWRFADQDPGAESRVLSSGPMGRAANLALNFASSLPDQLRRRVMRITG